MSKIFLTYESPEKGSLRAIIFYLKCKAGWREEEPEVREIPPIQISVLKP